jgi:hypothetical protein
MFYDDELLNWIIEQGSAILVKEVTKTQLKALGEFLMKNGAKIVGNLFTSIVSIIETGPKIGYFIYDIITAPKELWYYVKQENGIITVKVQTRPPNKPRAPNGPSNGTAGSSVTFTAVTTDPDGDNIRYKFDWGDGSPNRYSPEVPSGSEGSASHTYTSAGTYQVKVSAQDIYGAPSDWSITTQITISAGGENNAPNTPITPKGPSSGNVNITYSFSSFATDPDGDRVAIRFDWGDGNISDWSSFVASG